MRCPERRVRSGSAPRNWAAREGVPSPLGATWVERELAYNFALYSKHAERVTLLLYTEDDVTNPVVTCPLSHLTNKSGRVWHCRIPKVAMRGARYYAYSVAGPTPVGRFEWHAFDPQKVLLDPYAKAIFFPATFDRAGATRPGSNAGQAPLGLICGDEALFVWHGDRRLRHEWDAVIHELHIRGFTMNPNSGVGPEARGTCAGVIEKIPYLKDRGVTAVELMRVFQYDPQEGDYWGYMPLSFFAPHQGYATARDACACEQHNEFQAMVNALHAADIEVVLDVVYNHTPEGDHRGPVYSYKGIDNSTYYLISDRPQAPYENFSGTGNSLHCANHYVRKMILDYPGQPPLLGQRDARRWLPVRSGVHLRAERGRQHRPGRRADLR